MDIFQHLAEKKISQAIQEGTLRTDGWQNRPLPLDDDSLVPPDLRMAYKMLKNAGYLPPEVETRREIARLTDLISATTDENQRLRQMRKLDVLLVKLSTQQGRTINLALQEDYYRKVVERIPVRERNMTP